MVIRLREASSFSARERRKEEEREGGDSEAALEVTEM